MGCIFVIRSTSFQTSRGKLRYDLKFSMISNHFWYILCHSFWSITSSFTSCWVMHGFEDPTITATEVTVLLINLLYGIGLFLYPLKTSESQRFSDVSGGIEIYQWHEIVKLTWCFKTTNSVFQSIPVVLFCHLPLFHKSIILKGLFKWSLWKYPQIPKILCYRTIHCKNCCHKLSFFLMILTCLAEITRKFFHRHNKFQQNCIFLIFHGISHTKQLNNLTASSSMMLIKTWSTHLSLIGVPRPMIYFTWK